MTFRFADLRNGSLTSRWAPRPTSQDLGDLIILICKTVFIFEIISWISRSPLNPLSGLRQLYYLKEVLVYRWMGYLKHGSSHPLFLLAPTPTLSCFLPSHTLTRRGHSEAQRGGCTYTQQHVRDNMARIPHPCVTISACLAGALLLLPLCLGECLSVCARERTKAARLIITSMREVVVGECLERKQKWRKVQIRVERDIPGENWKKKVMKNYMCWTVLSCLMSVYTQTRVCEPCRDPWQGR